MAEGPGVFRFLGLKVDQCSVPHGGDGGGQVWKTLNWSLRPLQEVSSDSFSQACHKPLRRDSYLWASHCDELELNFKLLHTYSQNIAVNQYFSNFSEIS